MKRPRQVPRPKRPQVIDLDPGGWADDGEARMRVAVEQAIERSDRVVIIAVQRGMGGSTEVVCTYGRRRSPRVTVPEVAGVLLREAVDWSGGKGS